MVESRGRICMKKNRIDWVDCAKGITLLLVIIGHTVSTDASNMVRVLSAFQNFVPGNL